MLKKILFFLFSCIVTSCANYAGMHTEAKMLAANDLHTDSHPKSSSKTWVTINWWERFHDANLNALEQQAIANNPDLKIAEARVRLAQQLIEQANAATLPKANLSSSIQRNRVSENSLYPPSFVPTNYTSNNLAVNFNYDFDFWGKNREALKAALNEAQATSADLIAAKLVLTTAVAQTYIKIQSDYARIAIARDLNAQRANMFHLTQLQRQQGIASNLESEQAKADAEAVKMDLEQLQQDLALQQHQLAILLGKNPETFIPVNKTVNSLNFSLPAVIPARLLGDRPDIIALRWRIEAALHHINVAKAQFYPNINLAGSNIGLQSIGPLSTFLKGSSLNGLAGPAITLPIFDTGILRGNLGEKNANFDIAVEQYNQRILTAMQQVADHISALRSLERQQRIQYAHLQATQRNYALTQMRYRSGLDNALNTMQSKIPYLIQQDLQIQLKLQQKIAMINLINALGGSYP